MSFETMWVKAKAMLSVPSVTMNAGSLTPVTSAPWRTFVVRAPSAPRSVYDSSISLSGPPRGGNW